MGRIDLGPNGFSTANRAGPRFVPLQQSLLRQHHCQGDAAKSSACVVEETSAVERMMAGDCCCIHDIHRCRFCVPVGGATGVLYSRRSADGILPLHLSREMQKRPRFQRRLHRILCNVIPEIMKLRFTADEMIKLIRLPELSKQISLRRSGS